MGSRSKQRPTRRAAQFCNVARQIAAALLTGMYASTAMNIDGANQLPMRSVHHGTQAS